MSTKVTISHSSKHHLYEEIFDRSNVYLQIEGYDFEVSNNKVMIQIPIEVWRPMVEDWTQRGWPKEEDNKELDFGENLLETLDARLTSLGVARDREISKKIK